MKEVLIKSEFIKLDQLLKFADVVDSGGMAKILIGEDRVKVNGNICNQRGKKIYENDVVEIDSIVLKVVK